MKGVIYFGGWVNYCLFHSRHVGRREIPGVNNSMNDHSGTEQSHKYSHSCGMGSEISVIKKAQHYGSGEKTEIISS